MPLSTTPSPPPPARHRLTALEGLRGLLALWVAVSHAVCFAGLSVSFQEGPFKIPWNVFVFAQSAVGVFIILSGYAIWRLLEREQGRWLPFMRGRIYRIYPVYLFALLLGGISALLHPSIRAALPWGGEFYFGMLAVHSNAEAAQPAAHVAAHLLLLHGTLPGTLLPAAAATLLAPAWSLSLEWQFYLVAPLLWQWRKSALTWAALAAVAYLGHRYFHYFNNPMNAFLPAHLPLFAIGIGSAVLEDQWRTGNTRTRRLLSAAVALAGGIAWWIHLDLWALLLWIPTFLAATRCLDTLPLAGSLRRILESRPLQWLGHISYPLYLLHWPLLIFSLGAFLAITPRWSKPAMLTALLLVVLPLILAASHLVHRLIEKPAMDRARRHRKP